MSDETSASGLWSFLKDALHSIGFYWTLAAVLLVLAVYRFSANLREIRKSVVTILLFRQTKPVVNATVEERKESIEKRIEAVRAIEEDSSVSDDDENSDEG